MEMDVDAGKAHLLGEKPSRAQKDGNTYMNGMTCNWLYSFRLECADPLDRLLRAGQDGLIVGWI